MNNLLVRDFFEERNKLKDRDFLIYTIAFNTAPTLMGVKPATLINISRDLNNSYDIWEKNKKVISCELNVKFFELKKTSSNIFVLFYNEGFILNILMDKNIKIFLEKLLYDTDGGLDSILNRLRDRFSEGCPDEIGIFLGIPLEDVKSYIVNSGRNYKLLSYWKVYSDIEEAELVFSLYEKSREEVIKNMLLSKKG